MKKILFNINNISVTYYACKKIVCYINESLTPYIMIIIYIYIMLVMIHIAFG